MAAGNTDDQYDVAISFAGENRAVAKDLVTRLLAKGYRVFYDEAQQAQLWGEDLVERLTHVYAEQARYCLVLVSAKYAEKVWTKVEFRSAIAGALFGAARDGRVLPLLLDDTKLPGLLPTVGHLDLRTMNVAEVVEILAHKLDGDPTPLPVVDGPKRRWWWLIGSAAAGAVVLGVVLLLVLPVFGDEQPTNSSPPARMLAHNHQRIPPNLGLDLDIDLPGHPDVPGMDISPSGDGNVIIGKSDGKPKLALVTSADETGPGLCRTVPEGSWTTPLTGIYNLREGDRICVRTDQGNYAVLTLRTVPSASDVFLDIDYVAWETR